MASVARLSPKQHNSGGALPAPQGQQLLILGGLSSFYPHPWQYPGTADQFENQAGVF